MNRWFRRGQINKGLIVVLVLLVALVVIFYAWKTRTGSKEKKQIASEWLRDSYTLWCAECQKTFEIPRAQVESIPKQGRDYQCPECKKFVARWGQPSTGVLEAPAESGP